EGTNDLLEVVDASFPAGKRSSPWRFAARAECLRCHNAWAGETLTLNWLQLGASSSKNGLASSAAELTRLQHAGLLHISDVPNDLPSLVDPNDVTASIPARARAWLHVNCSTCHRFGAGGTAAIHLNLEKPWREMRALDERPLRGEFGLVGARII